MPSRESNEQRMQKKTWKKKTKQLKATVSGVRTKNKQQFEKLFAIFLKSWMSLKSLNHQKKIEQMIFN